MIKFKKGDRIRYIGNSFLSANKGAEAFVIREEYTYFQEIFIDIKWINNKLRNEQERGGYYSKSFELSCKGSKKCKTCKRRLQCITEGV